MEGKENDSREQQKIKSPKQSNNPINKCANKLNRCFSKEEIQMTKKYMKNCLTSLPIRERKIKTTWRFYLTQFRITVIKNKNNKCCKGCEEKEKLSYIWEESKLIQPLWK